MNRTTFNEFNNNTKIISIDSDDRDITKYPYSNNFEIICPQSYSNVYSIKLLNLSIPSSIYNISEYLQNNKLSIDNSLIIIEDGCYNSDKLVEVLNIELSNNQLNYIKCYFNNSSQKITFESNNSQNFVLDFTKIINYNNSKYCNYNIYNQHSNWGLGAVLGFKKIKYQETNSYISDNQVNIYNYDTIYLEINNFNLLDKIEPYKINYNTNNSNGKKNSSFAKIDIAKINYSNLDNLPQIILKNYKEIQNNNILNNPIEKLNKLQFNIKYHNGLLVDIPNNKHITFTLAIN
jgi:hypothetical protein|tara:strand:- start:8085 stop:8957 length:873 start_codon:yes stop_codon:yes gene_type:complete